MEYILHPGSKYEDIDLDDTDRILASKPSLAHAQFSQLLSQPDHVLASPEPLTPLGALRAATKLPNDDVNKPVVLQRAKKEYALDQLMKEFVVGDKGDLVNRWLLYCLQQSWLLVLLLYTTFVTQTSLEIRDSRRWQNDVLYYWWRDGTFVTRESLSSPYVSDKTVLPRWEVSSQKAPPQPRALSENDLPIKPKHMRRRISSGSMDAIDK
jgi:hypothetical protein